MSNLDAAGYVQEWGEVVSGGAALGGVVLFLLAVAYNEVSGAGANPLAALERGAATGGAVGLVLLLARLA